MKKRTSPTLFHSDFDNFDQYINDVKGAGSIHTAHGIMLQEVESTNSPPILEDMSPIDHSKERSIHLSIKIYLNIPNKEKITDHKNDKNQWH